MFCITGHIHAVLARVIIHIAPPDHTEYDIGLLSLMKLYLTIMSFMMHVTVVRVGATWTRGVILPYPSLNHSGTQHKPPRVSDGHPRFKNKCAIPYNFTWVARSSPDEGQS